MSSFAAKDQPVIFWTPDYGAVIVRGAMNAAWQKLGGATGSLGAPMADQTENGNVITQRFSGGVVSWDRSKKTFSTEPANLAPQLAGLQVPGQEVPKAPAATRRPQTPTATSGSRGAGGGCLRSFRCWSWPGWWPLRRCATAAGGVRTRWSTADGDEYGHGGSEAFGAVPAQGAGCGNCRRPRARRLFSGQLRARGRGVPAGHVRAPEYSTGTDESVGTA